MRKLEHFAENEFRCPCDYECGLGFEHMQPAFLQRLDRARDIAGVPFVLTSTVRCLEHNKVVGGVDSSAHVDGWAADVSATTSRLRHAVIRAAIAAGFNRIGVAKTFIHLDCDPSKPRNVTWVY